MDGHPARDERVALIGRERDLALVEQHLTQSRLVTITGLGGIGKTALAREVAARSAAAGAPAHFVDLASIATASGVPATIATVVGVGDEGDDDLEAAIASRLVALPALIVLDTFEHVLDARGVVSRLLDGAPAVRILATSRVPLGLAGEFAMTLGALAIPGRGGDVATSPAGALFLERRADRAGRHRLDDDDLGAVVEICRRLDGVPLALELAAAWTGILTPRAVARRLIDGRLDLAGDDPRHASIEAVVESTLDLVDARNRERFGRLGAFVGSFDEPAAKAVLDIDDPLPTLRALADAALVRVSADSDGEPRFELLETIRAVALRRLTRAGERAEAFRRHIDHYAGRAVAAADAVRSSSFSDARAGAVLADPNLVVAFDRALESGENESLARIATGVSTRAMQTGLLRDGLARLERAAALPNLSPWAAASVLNSIVSIRGGLRSAGDQAGDAARAVDLARVCGDETLLVRTLITLGNWRREDRAAPYAEAAEIAERIGYGWGAETAWLSLADVHWETDRADDALAALERGVAVAARIGDDAGMANALAARGELRLNVGRLEAGLADLRAAAVIASRHPGLPMFVTIGLTAAAMAEALAGDRRTAYRNLAVAGERLAASEFRADPLSWLESAVVVLAADHPAAAARAKGAFDAGVDLDLETPISRRLHDRALHDLEHALGRTRLERERAAGRAADVSATTEELMRIVRREARRSSVIAAPFGALTAREQEILAHLAEGRTDREIAAALAITAKTASVHVANLKAKLGVATRVEAVLFARDRLGWSGQGSGRPIRPSA